MGLTINTNIAALNAQRNLGASQAELGTSMQRLSSGLRINSAKDDAAGLAISDRMTAQIRGMNQAVRNLNDGISLLQTAEGALQEVTNLIQRGRELAVQAGNEATLSETDKDSLQAEIVQIKAEIDRIGQTTTFNGIKVLDHGEGGSIGGNPERAEIVENLKSAWLANSEKLLGDEYGLFVENVPFSVEFVEGEESPATNAVAWMTSSYSGGELVSTKLTVDLDHYTSGDAEFDRVIAHEMTHAIMSGNMNLSGIKESDFWFVEGTAEFVTGGDTRLAGALGTTNPTATEADALINSFTPDEIDTSDQYAAGYAAVRFLHAEIKEAGGDDGIAEIMEYLSQQDLDATLSDAFDHIKTTYDSFAFNDITEFRTAIQTPSGDFSDFIVGMDLTNDDVGAIGGFDADGGPVEIAADVVADEPWQYDDDPLEGFVETWPTADELGTEEIASREFAYQAGANAGEFISVSIGSADTEVLNLADVDISKNAGLAIERFDAALEYIDEMRGEMGAVMNRLESSIANQQNVAENLSAARSRILDADIAMETSSMTKNNILQQAGVSILSQANQAPQLALSLLG